MDNIYHNSNNNRRSNNNMSTRNRYKQGTVNRKKSKVMQKLIKLRMETIIIIIIIQSLFLSYYSLKSIERLLFVRDPQTK